jgi:tRNA G10  N-methylase Trm11
VNQYYKKDFFDAVVADLPYGVQHASKDNKKSRDGHGGGFTRNAMGLLQESLPGWLRVLRPGGSVVLAWNVFLIPRRDMEALFAAHGLSVPETVAALDFTHRVDQAIERDVIVGIKKG